MSEKEGEESSGDMILEDAEEIPGKHLFPCPYCGRTEDERYGPFDEKIKLANHCRNVCPEAKKKKEEKEMQKAQQSLQAAQGINKPEPEIPTPQPPKPEELTPRQRVAFYGPEELEKIKKEMLEKFLATAPQVGKKVSDWILQQWDLDPNVREDPNYLNDLLRDAGVPIHMAYRAVNLVLALDDEMRDVLQQRDIHFRRPQTREPYRREFGYPARSFPSERFADRFGERPLRRVRPGVYEEEYPREYSREERGSEISWRIEREVERATKPLTDKLDKIAEELKESRKPQQEQNVEIWRPKQDSDGNLLMDGNGKPIMERILAPATMAEKFMPKEDAELNFLKKAEYWKTLYGQPPPAPAGEELTMEKVREAIRSEKDTVTKEDVKTMVTEAIRETAPTVSPEMAKLQEKVETMTKDLADTKEKMTQEKFDAVKKELEDVKGLMRQISTGEYKEDSMKLLAKSIDTATDLLKDRKPVEKAMDKMFPEIPPIPDASQPTQATRREPVKPSPQAKKVAQTAMEQLEKEGYVVDH